MTLPAMQWDESETSVAWWVLRSAVGERLSCPWAEFWRLPDEGAGHVVLVQATEVFTLYMHLPQISFVEPITPGCHRFLLTHLDRGDVRRVGI